MTPVVAFLTISFIYPTETFNPPSLRYEGTSALETCLGAAAEFLRGADRQMYPGSQATASCRIERAK